MTYPSRLVAVNIGKESSYGTPATPTYSMPAHPQFADNHQPQPDTAWRGAPASSFGHGLGTLDSILALDGPAYADIIGFPLAGILGDLSTTIGTPNTQSIAALNTGLQQTPSYTLYLADGLDCLQWPGCKFNSVTIAGSGDGILQWSGALQGMPGSVVTAPAKNFTGVPMFAGWAGNVQIGGVTDLHVLDFSVTIARTVVAQRNADGSQTPYGQRSEELTVTGAATLAMTSDAYRALYIAGTATSIDIAYAQGAGAGLQAIGLHSSLVTLTAAARDYSSSRWIELPITWVADANTTDVGASGGRSPIKATLRNTVPAGTYA